MENNTTTFKTVFDSTPLNDGLYFFLQSVHRHYPEDQLHYILAMAAKEKKTDEDCYKEAQKKLPEIKPIMAKYTYVLPGLRKLMKEMARQVLPLLGEVATIEGTLEIGSAGGFINAISKKVKLHGSKYAMHNIASTNTIASMVERGGLFKKHEYLPLLYQPISPADIADESLGIVACFNGLHHCPATLLPGFIAAIHRVLRPGGIFILREHDVQTPLLQTLVLFAHTVINLSANIPWVENVGKEPYLMPVSEWSAMLSAAGFIDSGARILQDKDPTRNTLMVFRKG